MPSARLRINEEKMATTVTTCTRGGSACAFFHIAKNGWRRIAVQCGKCWISATKRFQRNPHKPFWPSLSIEYVTSISRQTDAPEVRFGLTDTQTDKPNYSNPRCTCVSRVNKSEIFKVEVWRQNLELQWPNGPSQSGSNSLQVTRLTHELNTVVGDSA